MAHIGYVMVSSHSFPFIMALRQVTVPRFVTGKLRLQELCEALSQLGGDSGQRSAAPLALVTSWSRSYKLLSPGTNLHMVSRRFFEKTKSSGNSIDRSASRLPSCRPTATSSRHALCNPACLCPSYNRPIDPMGLRCHKFLDSLCWCIPAFHMSRKKKTTPYFPLNPGCFIGIRFIVY